MERTPTRKSPRFLQPEVVIVSQGNKVTPAAPESSIKNSAATTIEPSNNASVIATTSECTNPSVTSEVFDSFATATTVTVPTVPSQTAIAAASQQNSLLQEMHRRIVVLESQLKAAQTNWNNNDSHYQSLGRALPMPPHVSASHTPHVQVPPSSVPLPHNTVALLPTVNYMTPSTAPLPTVSFVSPSLVTFSSATVTLSPTSSNTSSSFPNGERRQVVPLPTIDRNHAPLSSDQQRPAAEVNSVYSHVQPTMQPSITNTLSSQFSSRKVQDLPEFSGRAEDWPMFATAYTETTTAYQYTNLESCQRLQKCLKGEAREAVQCLLIHPDNVNAVMEQLRFRFGRPEQLIRSQLRVVKEITPIAEGLIEKLIPFATKVNNLVVYLKSVNGQQHLANPTLLDELTAKLPMSKRVDWATYAAPIQPYPTITDFSNWLNKLAAVVCTVRDATTEPKHRRLVLHATNEKYIPECPVCHDKHKIVDCKRFSENDIDGRWSEVKRLRLCFTCLQPGHSTRNCRRRRKPCDIDGCRRNHHKLLHESRSPPSHSSRPPTDANSSVLNCVVEPSQNPKLLFRILPVRLFGPKKKVDVYALLDEGSSITMMDLSLAKELGLNGRQSKLNIQWVGGRTAQEQTTVVNVEVSGIQQKKKHMLRKVYAINDLCLPVQTLDERELVGYENTLKRLPIQPYSAVKPRILIGLDHCHLGLPTETVQLKEKGPYAVKTELGWVVFGPSTGVSPSPKLSCLLIDDDIQNLIMDYFDTESFGVRPAPVVETADDVRARSILKATTIKVKGRFQTGLLWKSEDIELPDSYAMAKKRLVGIERKMKRDIAFAAAYKEVIQGYVRKGYVRKLQPYEANVVSLRTWYLPHFAVVNPNKPGKMRLVFDAAATVQGVSLNSCLLKGPQQYQPMPSVLFNFRVGTIAICGDIREMFHQVLVRAEDRSAQRFLWRNGDDGRPPDVYEMLVMTFGAACSPCAAEYVKNTNALEHSAQDPRAVKSILQHHYVDDFVDSFESEEQAIVIAKRVREIHQGAGFELRGFVSNSARVTRVMAAIAGRPEVGSGSMEESISTEKVLGMFWQPSSDTFKYQLKFNRVNPEIVAGIKRPSKRELLSVVMSVFDPLGFLSHLLIGAKLIMREVWRYDMSWDQPLPDNINCAWRKWCRQINDAVQVRIPRHYFLNDAAPKEVQLHVFVDASEEAFAAVAYWRIVQSSGDIVVVLVCTKTKCAPLKPMTIPRVELQAAVLGTRLMQTIIAEHSFEIKRRILWSDSKTVVKWIGSHSRRYKPFVAHRVAEILAATDPSNWRWIPTQDNVADEATRINHQIDFSLSSRWFSGPTFLRKNEDMWPNDPAEEQLQEDDNEELRPKFAMLAVSYKFINFSRFSSLIKLKRMVAWIIRFVNRSRRKVGAEADISLTAAELDDAESFLCRRVQEESYASEISLVISGQSLAKGSSLYNLMPYVDEKGILRVYGRIDAASWMPYDSRRPIILPPDHEFTKLVATHYHCRMKHQNVEATICEIRRKFWVPRLRRLIQKIAASCSVCQMERAMPVMPMMGQLPEDRVTPFVRPFSYTGLDYFGPLSISNGRRIEKRWVALFTCLTVRAIHLEIASDLSTDACILVIRNFINRRGVPVRIRSDNGKNFIGADREAKRFSEVFDCERIQDEMSSRRVEWVFNCPNNPSEGGVWERMVQCVKRVLRHTLKEIAPREHTLHCLLIEAENIVNSRPLTHLSISPDQEEPLTPNHFLVGTANTAQTPDSNEPLKKLCGLRKQWRIARQLRDRFWKRWIAEYLPTLTRRAKWCQRTTPLREGDLVFVCDANIPRKQWCRGKVLRVYCGTDGEVRRADIRTKTGILRRPVSKLAVLNVADGESD